MMMMMIMVMMIMRCLYMNAVQQHCAERQWSLCGHAATVAGRLSEPPRQGQG